MFLSGMWAIRVRARKGEEWYNKTVQHGHCWYPEWSIDGLIWRPVVSYEEGRFELVWPSRTEEDALLVANLFKEAVEV